MSVPTSIPRPNGRSCLNNSDLIPNREHTHAQKLYNSFTGTVGQVVPQNPTGPESRPELSGTDDSTPTFDTTKFYQVGFPSEIKELVHHHYSMLNQ